MVLRFFFFAFLLGCADIERDNPQDPSNVDGKAYSITVRNGIRWTGNMNHKVSGSKCYGDEPSNCDTYGRLYSYGMAKDVCPGTWRLPTKAECLALPYSFFSNQMGGQYEPMYGYLGIGNSSYLWHSDNGVIQVYRSAVDEFSGYDGFYASVRCVKDLKEDL